MNCEQVDVLESCAELSAAGRIHFGEVVARLLSAGVERYHADYTRGETTYYSTQGGSHVVSMSHLVGTVAAAFDAEGIRSAIRRSQLGEIMYPEFSRLALAAGCVGYFVQLTGSRVQYFGRKGDVHTEWFPGAKPAGS